MDIFTITAIVGLAIFGFLFWNVLRRNDPKYRYYENNGIYRIKIKEPT